MPPKYDPEIYNRLDEAFPPRKWCGVKLYSTEHPEGVEIETIINTPSGPITADQIDYGGGLINYVYHADRFAAPPPPYEPTPGEKRLAERLEVAGWTEVEIVPPRRHLYNNPDGTPIEGSIEVTAWDGPDHDWHIRVDGGDDGRVEGYQVSGQWGPGDRIPAHSVPTPNEAVGAWEAQQRAAAEAQQPRGRKA